MDDQPTFSYPLTLTTNALTFGTQAQAGWGNALNVYYRVRAVSAQQCPQSPFHDAYYSRHQQCAGPASACAWTAAGATASPCLDWSDTANPQVPGYDLDVDTDPDYAGDLGDYF